MLLSNSTYLIWVSCILLEVVVCILALRQRLFQRLPLLTTYLFLVLVRDLLWWGVTRVFGYGSAAAFYFAWSAQAVLLTARGLAIAELCLCVLRPYRGVWALARWVLIATAAVLLLFAGMAAEHSLPWMAQFILRGERGLELTAISILVLLLALSHYYGIRMDSTTKLLAVGLGFYSAVQVVNNTILAGWLNRYFISWNAIRSTSYLVALATWVLALRKPVIGEERVPQLLSHQTYEELAPEVNYRLRLLNTRLLEILKP